MSSFRVDGGLFFFVSVYSIMLIAHTTDAAEITRFLPILAQVHACVVRPRIL